MLLDEAAEAGEVGGDAGDTHDGTLGGGVAPGLVVGREHAHVAASDELFVVETNQRIVTVQKVRMEDDFYSVLWIIEHVASLQRLNDWVFVIFNYIVRSNWRPK